MYLPTSAFAEGKHLIHFHNVEMYFYRPQTFLSVYFYCRDDVSEFDIDISALRRAECRGDPQDLCGMYGHSMEILEV